MNAPGTIPTEITQEVLAMGNVVSHVPELLKERGWEPMDLVRKANIAVDTAYRLARGETNFNIETLEKLCLAFGVPTNEVVEVVQQEE